MPPLTTPPDTFESVTKAQLSEDPSRRPGLQEIYRYTRRTWARAQAERYLRELAQRFTANV